MSKPGVVPDLQNLTPSLHVYSDESSAILRYLAAAGADSPTSSPILTCPSILIVRSSSTFPMISTCAQSKFSFYTYGCDVGSCGTRGNTGTGRNEPYLRESHLNFAAIRRLHDCSSVLELQKAVRQPRQRWSRQRETDGDQLGHKPDRLAFVVGHESLVDAWCTFIGHLGCDVGSVGGSERNRPWRPRACARRDP